VVVAGLGLLGWARTPVGKAVLLRLGADKMYAPVQAAIGEAIGRSLPAFRPGPAGPLDQAEPDHPADPGQGTAGDFDWPFPVAGPGAAIRCRLLPVPPELTFWEIQADLAGEIATVGGRVLWGERIGCPPPGGDRGRPDEVHDLLRLDLGVDRRPTHSLLLYKPDGRAPELRWGGRPESRAWNVLAGQKGRPPVAIVLDDWGYFENQVTRDLLALDLPLTLAILPGLPFSRRFALAGTELALPSRPGERLSSARRSDLRRQRLAAGCPVEFGLGRGGSRLATRRREVILHLPMEPEGYPEIDPGPGAIRVGMDVAEIGRLIDAALASLPGVSGVNNHMGSRVTADPVTMARIMSVLARKELFFLDSLTTPRSVAVAAAEKAGVPALRSRITLDEVEPDRRQVLRNLQVLLRAARATGFAVGIGHPYPETLAALSAELPRWQEEGVRLVTLSELLALREQGDPAPAGP